MLKQRRNEAKVTMMYKILNNLLFVDHDLEFNTFKLTTLFTRINIYHDSFFPSTIILWNNLPAQLLCKKNCNSYFLTDNFIFFLKYVLFSS